MTGYKHPQRLNINTQVTFNHEVIFNLIKMSVSPCHKAKTMTKHGNKFLNDVPARDDSNYSGQELLEALNKAYYDKLKLESENKILDEEASDCKRKLEMCEELVEKNQSRHNLEISKLKECLKTNEFELKENTKCLELQASKVEALNLQIKILTDENNRLRYKLKEQVRQHENTVTVFEQEILKRGKYCNTLKTQFEQEQLNTNKYKGKLTFATGLINELNNLLNKYTSRPEVIQASTQTNFQIESIPTAVSTPKVHSTKEEDLILSDIFFKTKPFSENEMALFQHLNNK